MPEVRHLHRRRQHRVRRLAVAAALVATVVLSVLVVQDAERPTAGPEVSPPPSLVTSVLSARRVPTLLLAPVANAQLSARLDALRAQLPDTTCITVNVEGRPVYRTGTQLPLVPASLLKLLTALSALQTIGPATKFSTRAVAAAAPDGGVVQGDLYVVGGGDPLLSTAAYASRFEHQPQLFTDIAALADALEAAGVSRIEGSVVGDESRYDTVRYVPEWPEKWITQDQTGPLSALDVNDGFIAFPPRFDVHTPDEEPAPNPAQYTAQVLVDLLGQRGISVTGGAGAGVAPTGAVDVASVASPTVAEIVREMLLESDNQTAELLTKEIGLRDGGAGTTATGRSMVAADGAAAGLPMAGVVVGDGSGLANEDRLTCDLVQTLLDGEGPQSVIAGALPVAGQSGTLTKRFVGTPVAGRMKAKTGTLNQATALAGFVESLQGTALSFSYIVNLPPGQVVGDDDLALQDELGEALVSYPEGPPLAAVSPVPVE